MVKKTAVETVRETLRDASAFYQRHFVDGPRSGEPQPVPLDTLKTTFGYFTHHPVAPLNARRLELLLERIDSASRELGRPLRVIDLACGGGLITGAVARLGHRALGIDLDEREIHWAKLFALETRVNAIFWRADLLAPSQPPSPHDPHGRPWERTAEDALGGKPDIVLLAYALHHLPDPEPLVKRLAAWLDPSARLLINEENPDSLTFRLKHRVREWIQHDTEAEHHRSLSAWKGLLEAHGFRIDFLAGRDVLPGLARLSPARCWSLVLVAKR